MANIIEHLQKQEFAKVLQFCHQELDKNPDDNNLVIVKGWCLFHLKQIDEATSCIQQGIYTPNLHIFSIKLTQDFFFLVDDNESIIRSCEFHLPQHPKDTDLWFRLARSRALLGNEAQAINDFKHGLTMKPNDAKMRFSLSLLLLNAEKFQEAWPLYESRLQAHPNGNYFQPNSPIKLWTGQDLRGKSLLLWSEQGFGDTIQFIRLANILHEQGVEISLLLKEQHQSLQEILTTVKGIKKIYAVSNGRYTLPNQIEFHCPLMSILYRLNITQDNIPSSTPYLSAPTVNQPQWSFLKESKNCKIGIVWSTQTPIDGHQLRQTIGKGSQRKNIELSELENLFDNQNIDFYSLQYGVSDKEAKQLKNYQVTNLSENIQSFSDTAAIIQHMDVVISIDTATVHLAGALNKPTINLLPYVNDWRWKSVKGCSHWYPSMKLLTQEKIGEWQPVIQQLIQICKRIQIHHTKHQTVSWEKL